MKNVHVWSTLVDHCFVCHLYEPEWVVLFLVLKCQMKKNNFFSDYLYF